MLTNGIERVNINKDGIVNFKNSSAIKIPVGNNIFIGVNGGEKPVLNSNDNGYIRYNSDNKEFEGYGNGAWGSLGGVKNVAGDTYIKATDSNNIEFYTSGTKLIVINSGGNVGIGTNQPDSSYKVDITGSTQISENIVIKGNTDDTNSSTGSVVISGGVGIAKNLHVNGSITGSLTGNATSADKSDKSDKLQLTSKSDNHNYDVPFFNNTGGSYKDVNFSGTKTIKYNQV